MRSNIIEEYKKSLRLTDEQREILAGLLLGDGHLETLTNGKTYRLKVEHGIQQKDYVIWLYDKFKEWVPKPPRERIKYSLGKDRMTYGFTTYASAAFASFGNLFYPNKKKIIPLAIEKLLTRKALAIWFMDDGSWKSKYHRTYIIHAVGSKKDELMLMRKTMQRKFNIAISLHKQYENWRVYIPTAEAEKFRNIIEPHIIPSMAYKLEG